MKKRFWKIEGYDSANKIFEKEVPVGAWSETRIKEVLRVLAAKAGLDMDEIVGAYTKRRTKGANDLLEVRRDRLHPRFTCGTNPFFTARVIERDVYNKAKQAGTR